MNFDRSIIFAHLEEDNIQRAYFRVIPLLSLEGDIRQESVQLWPNEGGLRIVPDRNEQHTFKTRMRTLGSYCVIDLRHQPPEAGKIRTNKNFRPDRGEVNQYILYSDTVHELPEHTFYQLLDGEVENYVQLAEKAITPKFYIRTGDTLYGPISKTTPEKPETAQESAGVLFELPCPDNEVRMILCMDDSPQDVVSSDIAPNNKIESEEEPKSVTETPDKPSSADATPDADEQACAASSDPLPIGQTLHILDEEKSHEDTIRKLDQPVSSGANLLHQKPEAMPLEAVVVNSKNEPLSGTPLIRTPLRVSVPQMKNRTQEIINNQWSVGKYEPPAQNLPNGTAMRAINNPIEAACIHLREAWNVTSAHDQMLDCILSLDGIRLQLEEKLCNGNTRTILQHVLRQRLQDLEAERLTALCELDKAHKDLDSYKQEIITTIAGRLQRETKQYESARDTAQVQLDVLKQDVNALTLQRDALLARISDLQSNALPEAVAKVIADAHMLAPVTGIPLRMSPITGKKAGIEELVVRICTVFQASGLNVDRNTAIAIMVLFAVCHRIGISCPTPAPFATLMKNLTTALGWQSSYAHQYSQEQKPIIGERPVDSTPAILMTSLPNYAPITDATKLLFSRNTAGLLRNAAYDVNQWPVWMLPALPYVDECEKAPESIISRDSFADLLAESKVSTQELDSILGPVLKAAIPLSGAARKELYQFVAACSNLMEGGLPVAADWGILLWIVPALEKGSKHFNGVKALLDEYPLSLSHF